MRSVDAWLKRKTKPIIDESQKSGHPFDLLKRLFTGGLFLTVGLVLIASLVALSGCILRWYNPETQIILTTVSGPFAFKTDASSIFGRQVADILSNDINEIIQAGSSFVGNQNASSKSLGAQPFDPIPQIPISRSYGIEIKGVSVDQLMDIWNSIRYNQEIVSGAIIPVKDSADQFVIYISWNSNGKTYHWTSPGFASTNSALELFVWNSAEHFIKETDPEIAGRYYLSTQDYSDAIATFREWMILEPFRPEPYLYMAKTFDLIGDFGKATEFSDRALDLLVVAPRRSRSRVRVGIYLVESLSLLESPDDQNVSRLQQFVDTNLPDDPNARTNLGLRYLQKEKLNDSKRELNRALSIDPKDFRAAELLAESFMASKDLSNAIMEYDRALKLEPQSTIAATGLLRALIMSKDYSEASKYCRSWVLPESGSSGVMIDEKSDDLYLSCAESEQHIPRPDAGMLRWYYIESLRPGLANDNVSEQILSEPETLQNMHDALCELSSDEFPSGQKESTWVKSIADLAMRLTTRSISEKDLRPKAMDCENELAHLTSGSRPGASPKESEKKPVKAIPAAVSIEPKKMKDCSGVIPSQNCPT